MRQPPTPKPRPQMRAAITLAENGARGVTVKSTLRAPTKRPLSRNALRESEARFRTLAESVPVVVWMTGPDNRCTYISGFWREYTGRDPEQDLGFGWVEALHPEDRERAARDLMDASRSQTPCNGEYRVKRADGDYAWLHDHGVPYFHSDGSYAGHVGTCIDITEHKQHQHAGLQVQESLVLGQESERKRVAQELHDDISQRLALVGLELKELEQMDRAPVSPETKQKLGSVRKRIESIAQDIHQISHNLHPTTIDHIGLVPALRALCDDFSERTHIDVEFTSDIMSPPSSRDVAIALYRVTQESLNNVARHSGSSTARVVFAEAAGAFHLTIKDSGRGFDAGRLPKNGLGLVSLRERARMIGGSIRIASGVGRGTTVALHLPIERTGSG